MNDIPYSAITIFTVLHRTVLYCTALYCTALHCTVLYCTVLYCTVLYCVHCGFLAYALISGIIIMTHLLSVDQETACHHHDQYFTHFALFFLFCLACMYVRRDDEELAIISW